MKIICYYLCLGLLLIGCKSEPKEHSTTDLDATSDLEASIEGVWELTGYYNYSDNKVIDSFNINTGSRQVKMYSPTRVMWSKNVPSDSTEWFGYGTYTVKDGELTEILDYGSEMMRRIIDEKKEFTYELLLDKDRFTQIEIDEDGNRIYSENYTRIE